ncbi:TM2 domain-containing protein [Streptococcus cameli]
MSVFIDSFLAANATNLPAQSIPVLRQQLEQMDERQQSYLLSIEMKNPIVALIFSIFLGSFGIDRFYVGDIGLGVAKLCLSWFTFGIWPIVDWFLIMGVTKRKNLEKLQMAVQTSSSYRSF